MKFLIKFILDLFFFPLVIIFALISRFCKRGIDIGLGPEPIISYIFHKKALLAQGYSAETYVNKVYHIGDNII